MGSCNTKKIIKKDLEKDLSEDILNMEIPFCDNFS